MKQLRTIIIILALAMPFYSFKTLPDNGSVKWLTIEEAIALNKTKPKKILIDVYTDWCGWCKKMDKLTYTDAGIVKQLNEQFYLVKFNAEQKEDVMFREQLFKFRPDYKAHEFAVGLLNGQMSYPSTVFMDENMNLLTIVPGYLTPQDLDPILDYFGENYFKTMKWEEFQQQKSK